MRELLIVTAILFFPLSASSQESALGKLLADSSMTNASISLHVRDGYTGDVVMEYDSDKSLCSASVTKLFTTAAAVELLGPDHIFTTSIGYTGSVSKTTGELYGNIIIKGGGDPALGSENFTEHYGDFTGEWIDMISEKNIRKIHGQIITDDSYFDYFPVPGKWLWEDIGNYYGAGVYGLSVFDNTYKIHMNTVSEGLTPVITGITPAGCNYETINRLIAEGSSDRGYVYSQPYSSSGWIEGTVPSGREDFVLKASITDPPLLMAKILHNRLSGAGISISGESTTVRIEKERQLPNTEHITETHSPPLSRIIEIINHESINLYAEHLVKEMGRHFYRSGTYEAGMKVIREFLDDAGINTKGLYIEDGSGLSTLNSMTSVTVTDLLFYMKTKGRFFTDYYSSLPDAGKEGTLKYYFKDPLFENRMKAKSGSMTRVRNYAGFLKTLSGRELIFCILINDYSGSPVRIIKLTEEVLKDLILNE